MGRRGPPPKPAKLKELAGTRRPDREAPNVPEPDVGLPDLPADWGETLWGDLSIEAYWSIGPWLLEHGLLSPGYQFTFLALCDSWAQYRYFRRRVSHEGSTTRTPNGAWVQSPIIQLMNKALDNVRKYASEFGLSPAQITRVSSAVPSKKKENPFANLGAG